MDTKLYVSDVVSLDELTKEKFNLIKAPTGRGKTTFCIKKLKELARDTSRILYLCPTVELLNQLVEQNEEIRYYDPSIDDIANWDIKDFFEGGRDGETRPDDNRILAMTYEKFGMLTIKSKEVKPLKQSDGSYVFPDVTDFVDYYDVIIADEFHDYDWRIANELSTIKKQISKGNEWLSQETINKEASFRQYNGSVNLAAFNAITESCGKRYVIGISATPDCNYLKILETKELVNRINSCAALRAIEIKTIIKTDNIKRVISETPNDKVVLFFTPRITEMLAYEAWAKKCGFSTLSLWSSTNKDHPLSEEQVAAREWIKKNGTFPEGVNFLLINKAYEMGISIKTTVDMVVVNSNDETSWVQVPGRTRQENLDYLVIYDKEAKEEFSIPEKFLNRGLSKEDKDELCELMNLKDKRGTLLKWPSVKKYLAEQGLIIEDKRKTISGKKLTLSYISLKECA